MLTVATLLWDANARSLPFSKMYDETWVNRLYAGFRRHLTDPFRFVCFTDRPRVFKAGIDQERISAAVPDYGTCIEPYKLGEPMILVGLDTLVVGNIDHLRDFCLQSDIIGLPRDPYKLSRACNGVALVPAGKQDVFKAHRGENDMEWMRRQPHVFIDDIFKGHVVSYKGSVQKNGVRDARIIYFHGWPKFHQMLDDPLIKEHWRDDDL